jgi:hypothetical protein
MEQFAQGDKVQLKRGRFNSTGLNPTEFYMVGAVCDLPQPDDYYVDPSYWSDPRYTWAKEKTVLDVAGHPQVIFLEDVFLPPNTSTLVEDPEGKNRSSFSGAWFQKVA